MMRLKRDHKRLPNRVADFPSPSSFCDDGISSQMTAEMDRVGPCWRWRHVRVRLGFNVLKGLGRIYADVGSKEWMKNEGFYGAEDYVMPWTRTISIEIQTRNKSKFESTVSPSGIIPSSRQSFGRWTPSLRVFAAMKNVPRLDRL